MSWVDKAITVIWVLIVIRMQAKYQAYRFDVLHENISHEGKAIVFAIFCLPLAAFFYFTHHELSWLYSMPLIAGSERLAFFDPLLNYYRRPKRSLWYNSSLSAESWMDRLENRLSIFWVKVLKISYVVLFITLLITL